MKKISFIALVMIILTACNHRTEYANTEFGEIKILKAIDLSEYSSLQLCRNMDCNYICVSLLDPDGQVDEFMGISNANFCTNDKGEILFDTVCFHPQEPSYILKAYDVSSTYGAETWFVLSPYYQGNPDSFWSLYRLPFDRLAARDVDGDGLVTASDITALYNFILNNDSSSIVNGDQDGDGQITAGDITTVYNLILGSK